MEIYETAQFQTDLDALGITISREQESQFIRY